MKWRGERKWEWEMPSNRGEPQFYLGCTCVWSRFSLPSVARPVHGNLGKSGRRHSDTPRESPSTVVAMLPQPAQIRPRVPSIYLSHGPHAAPSCR